MVFYSEITTGTECGGTKGFLSGCRVPLWGTAESSFKNGWSGTELSQMRQTLSLRTVYRQQKEKEKELPEQKTARGDRAEERKMGKDWGRGERGDREKKRAGTSSKSGQCCWRPGGGPCTLPACG